MIGQTIGLFGLPDSESGVEIREMIEEIRHEYLDNHRDTRPLICFLGTRKDGDVENKTMLVLDLYNLRVYVDVDGYTTPCPHSAPAEVLERARTIGADLLSQYLRHRQKGDKLPQRHQAIPAYHFAPATISA